MLHAPARTASFLAALAAALAFALFLPGFAAAQGSDTIIDEANELSDAQEQDVQQAFDAAGQESGQPLYVILTPQTGRSEEQAQQELLIQEAREAGVSQDAGVVLVAPNDGWGQTYNFPQYAYDA